MEVHLKPDLIARLDRLTAETGRSVDDLIEDAMAGYLEELAQVRGMLDSRYDDLKYGKTQAVDGEAFFESLRRREEELLHRRSAQ